MSDTLKTYREWRLAGREVRKGEKPHSWAWNNWALYYWEQTEAANGR